MISKCLLCGAEGPLSAPGGWPEIGPCSTSGHSTQVYKRRYEGWTEQEICSSLIFTDENRYWLESAFQDSIYGVVFPKNFIVIDHG